MASHQAARGSHIDWQAPTLMVGSLIIGSSLAFGHHCFYQGLNHKEVSNEPIQVIKWTITSQQINIAVGTAFAFLVKASLVLSVSTAYSQLVLRALVKNSYRVGQLDRLFAGLNDIMSAMSLVTMWRRPLILLAVLVAWFLPLSAIIAPAALSVTLDQIPSTIRNITVPQPAFDSLSFVSYDWKAVQDYTIAPVKRAAAGFTGTLAYLGPSRAVSGVTFAVSGSGSIISVEPSGTNTSWDLSFEGPNLKCAPMNEQLVAAVKGNLATVFNASSTWVSENTHDYLELVGLFPSYLGWSTVNGDLPYHYLAANKSNPDGKASGWTLQTIDSPQNRHSKVMIGIFPNALTTPEEFYEGASYNKLVEIYFKGSTLVQCEPWSATYDVSIKYDEDIGGQSTTVSNIKDSTSMDALFSNWSLGTLDVGVDPKGDLFISRINDTQAKDAKVPSDREFMDKTSLQQASYSAIVQSFYRLLLGSVNKNGNGIDNAYLPGVTPGNLGLETTSSSLIFSTVLASTLERLAIQKNKLPINAMTGEQSGRSDDEILFLLPPTANANRPESLQSAIETLFQNITVSMMSSPALQYNQTSPTAPSPVSVTFTAYANIYTYSREQLWLPYGLAIGVSALCVLAGLLAIFRTGASFSVQFSTFLRIVQRAEFSGLPAGLESDEGLPGQDPLPKEVKQAVVSLRGKRVREEMWSD